MNDSRHEAIRRLIGQPDFDGGKNDLFQYILKLEEAYDCQAKELKRKNKLITTISYQLQESQEYIGKLMRGEV